MKKKIAIKKLACVAISILLGMSGVTVYGTQIQEYTRPTTVEAIPSTAKIMVNGKSIDSFEVYNIKGRNYVKLRDLAYMLNGTEAQFNVEWNAADKTVTIIDGASYVPVGGEMAESAKESKIALVTDTSYKREYKDGGKSTGTFSSNYLIDGSTFMSISVMVHNFDFNVGWDPERRIIAINTKTANSDSEGNITERYLNKLTETGSARMYAVVMAEDGGLWAWDEEGNDLPNRTIVRTKPEKIMDNIVSVAAGVGFYLAVDKDSVLWGWGWNEHGLLNDGTRENHAAPVKLMENVRYVTSVTTGDIIDSRTYIIKTDDSLWQWGYLKPPEKIMDNVAVVTLDLRLAMAITKDARLWSLGGNGQIGDGATESRKDPVEIMEDVVSVSGGGSSKMAVKKDGSLWHWGTISSNTQEPGTGRIYYNPVPTKIMDNVKSVTDNDVVTADGSVWTAIYLSGRQDSLDGSGRSSENQKQLYRVQRPNGVAEIELFNSGYELGTNGELWGRNDRFRTWRDGYWEVKTAEKIMDNVVSLPTDCVLITRVPEEQ